jgi:chorismate synthase
LAGNSIGKEFVVTSFGESHGKCVGVIIDGCPAGLPLSENDIQPELDMRIPSQLKIVSARREKDQLELLSGTFNGITTGAPICMLVKNKDTQSEDYESNKNIPRPGHADYAAATKYGRFNDYRGGGRFSGRVTVALVMAGAVAKKLLMKHGVDIVAYTSAVDGIRMEVAPKPENIREGRDENPIRCPDQLIAKRMEETIMKAREEGESVGGIIECVAMHLPVGIGEPIYDSLDSDLAKILFNIPAVKGVEFGAGFEAAEMKGSENNDPYQTENGKITTTTNNAGGILGGMSTGMNITARIAIKPTPSVAKEQHTVNMATMKNETIRVGGRHDPCIVPKAVPVVESAMAVILADHMMRAGFIPKVLKEAK